MQSALFDDLVTRIGNQQTVPIIAVSGDYGAGKTEFCKAFACYLSARGVTPLHVHTDMYFCYSRTERDKLLETFRKQNEYDRRQAEAYALDMQLMLAHLALMKQRKSIQAQRLYRRETGNKDLEIKFALEGNVWILYDGIWILDAALRQFYDKVLCLTAPRDTRMQRAILRASQQTKPYLVTHQLFDSIDRFTTEYLTRHAQDSDIRIDTSDYEDPSIIK